DHVRELRLAAVRPVDDVMRMREHRPTATGVATAAVARLQRALDRRRNASGLAADAERLAVRIVDDADQRAVAREPPRRLDRKLPLAVDLALHRAVAGVSAETFAGEQPLID